MDWQERGSDRLSHTGRDFKVCDCCGALNPATNAECFICRWSGKFHTDRETIGDAIRELEQEYGGLDESLFMEEVVPSTPPRPGFWAGLRNALKRIIGWE